MKSRVTLILFFVMILGLGSASAQGLADSRLRLVNAVADGAPVDLYIDSVLVAPDAEFGDATQHIKLEPGAHEVEARAAGADASEAPVFSQSVNVIEGLAFSLILQGDDAVLYEDILDPIAAGLARLAAIHALQGVAPIDIMRTDGAPLMVSVTYGQPYGTINIPVGPFDLVAAPAGEGVEAAIADFGTLHLRSNVLYTLLVAAEDDTLVLEAPINGEADSTLTRITNAAPDAPAVDVYLDESLIISGLETGTATRHIGLPSGEYDFALREAGSPPNAEAIFETTLTVGDSPQTVAIFGEDDELALEVLDDAADGVTSETVVIQVFNLGADALNLELSSGDVLAEDLEAGEVGDAVEVTPDVYQITGDVELEEAFFGGSYYSLLAFDGGDTVLTVTPIDVRLSSTPFGDAPVAVAAAADDAADTEDMADAASEPIVEESPEAEATAVEVAEAAPVEAQANTDAAPAGSSELVASEDAGGSPPAAVEAAQPEQPAAAPPVQEQPTPTPLPPTQPPPPPPPQPVVPAVPTRPYLYPPVEYVFGVIDLNQGVNIHCREYPSTSARSLALVPNATEVRIEGIFAPRDETGEEGRLDAITVEGVPDFSQLLDDDFSVADYGEEFLSSYDPGDLWLNVDWFLDDGTVFGCWMNAEYIEISFKNSFIDEFPEYLQLVKDLNFSLVPYNAPGGPRDPDATVSPDRLTVATPLPEATMIGTVNVNRGVNLQMRRTPGTDGESLALIPGGTQIDVLAKVDITPSGDIGAPTQPEWLYVELAQPDGSRLRGWLASEYVILTLGGRVAEIEDVPDVPEGEEVPRGGPVTEDGVVLFPSDTGGQAPEPQQAAPALPEIVGRLLIDPGATLNLRELPDPNALVRVSIPSGATVQVVGRNGSGEWLEVVVATETGNVQGWLSAAFISVTSQGQPYDVGILPITTGEADTFTPGTP